MKPGIYAKISISDSGAGILPEVKSRIFEPFFTTKGAGQGTGLGLAAVHGILEEHQGGIRVHSELGKGSTFELFVPLADDTIVVQVVQEKATCTGSGSVLVVDDERTLSSLVKQMLAELGYAVSAFMDPIEAFESYKADPSAYDLVIVDQSMPRMKGMEFAQQVWAINESAKVVMLTGFSEDITPEEAVRQGCFRCLVKPVEFDVLANCVAEAMLA